MEIPSGGNLITSTIRQPTIIICNEKPGYITLIDTRKAEAVKSFIAHIDEIKAIRVSEEENFIITLGTGNNRLIHSF